MRSCFVSGSVATTASSVGGLAATINLRPPELTILLSKQIDEKEKPLETGVFRRRKLCGGGAVEEATRKIVAMVMVCYSRRRRRIEKLRKRRIIRVKELREGGEREREREREMVFPFFLSCWF